MTLRLRAEHAKPARSKDEGWPEVTKPAEAMPRRVPTYSLTALACLVLGWENLTDVDRRFDLHTGAPLNALLTLVLVIATDTCVALRT